MFKYVLLGALILFAPISGREACAQSSWSQPSAVIDVVDYDATVTPDIQRGTISGLVIICLNVLTDGRVLVFDCGDLTVDGVREGSRALTFEARDRHLYVSLDQPARRGAAREIAVRYHGAPKRGVQFGRDPDFAITIFSTSEWMVCVDAPGDKASLSLTLLSQEGLTVVGPGRQLAPPSTQNGTLTTRWREDRPMSSYVFGFAIGNFGDAEDTIGTTRLRYLGAGLSREQLLGVFHNTGDVLSFLSARAGLPYPSSSYAQVIAGTGAGQEVDAFAVLPASYARAVLEQGDSGGLAVHELAHQWWGNLVTCRDWRHFWLNEGFATFMSAAYTEQTSGRDAYLRQIEVIRLRYEQVRGRGHDRALVFPDWNRPSADDRTIVYSKGAYVLHLLREELGDAAFWNGVAAYTRRYAGSSVTTEDFERTMSESSGRDLSSFFARWIYGASPQPGIERK